MDFVRSQEVGLLLHPPKSDDRYAQLTRGGFIINDFLLNPHFRMYCILSHTYVSFQITKSLKVGCCKLDFQINYLEMTMFNF